MRNRITLVVALLCATSAFVVAGCGGDDEEPTTSTEATSGATGTDGVALTEEEFVAQGNEICAAGNEEIDQAANETFAGQEPTDAQVEQFAGILVPSIQAQIDGIRALTPPEDLAADVDTFLADAEDALAEVEADSSLLLASDEEGPFADVNAQAVALGLTECAG
jgi:hypothetical protein